MTQRLMVECSTSTPRSSMSSSTWRVLSGYATDHRTPMRMTSGGKWAPLKLIAIVLLPHDVPLVMKGDHTVNGLKGKLATKPLVPVPAGRASKQESPGRQHDGGSR